MDRRRFVGAFTGGLVVARSVANAQPSAKVYRVGFLLGATRESVASLFGALKDGLRDLGYVEGRNVVFEQRYGGGNMERLPELAAELVRLHVDVIVTGTNLHVAAVRRATATIPIVMVFAENPVGSGFVASLARPGGNVTGLSADASPELWAKYLSLLKEVVPRLSRVGVVGQVASQVGFAELEKASRKLDLARGHRPSQPERLRRRVPGVDRQTGRRHLSRCRPADLFASPANRGRGDQIPPARYHERETICASRSADELRAEFG